MTNTNLCRHFSCPHYDSKDRCQKYAVTKACPVTEITGVTDKGRSLSIDVDRITRSRRALIKYAIQMTMENE